MQKAIIFGASYTGNYFSKAFHGVKDAVRYYCKKIGISYAPVGDTLSVIIRKCI